jgi:hypothetical protein
MFYGFEDPISDALERLYCLTGTESNAQNITMADYVRCTWPSTGKAMIELLGELLTNPQGEECSCKFLRTNYCDVQSDTSDEISSPSHAKVTATTDHPCQTVFSITAGPYLISEVVEQLGWLYSALQLPPFNRSIAVCSPSIEDLSFFPPVEAGSRIAIIAQCRLKVEFRDLDLAKAVQTIGQVPLGVRPYLIYGYPIKLGAQLERQSHYVSMKPSDLDYGRCLQALRLQLPKTLQEVVETVPKTSISVHSRNDDSASNKFQLILEDYTGLIWDWSPLYAPRKVVRPGMWRLEWTVSAFYFMA